MTNSKHLPKRRFKEFELDGEWELKKLSSIADIRDGTHSSPKYLEVGHPFITSKNVANGFISFEDIQYISDEDFNEINKRSKVDVHDILMGMIGTVGNLALIRQTPFFAIKNVALIKYTGDVDYEFLYQALQTSNVKRQLKDSIDGGTQKFISLKKIRNLNIPFSNISEQLKIGKFFQKIDSLLTLHQQKLDKLKNLKKAYLAELFPAEGERVPKRRFPGFEDDWKEVKLGEVGETYTGLSGKTKEDFGHGEGKFITYVNVFNNPLTDLYGLDSVEIDDKQRRVQYGDVLFTTSSETPEDVGLSSVWMGTEDNVYLNSFCFGYRPQKGIFDLYYLAFVLRSFSVRREFMLLAQGISRFNISKTKVMDISIHVPSLPEQEAIGSFFLQLDKSISLQQQKLDKLNDLKKAYLNELFV